MKMSHQLVFCAVAALSFAVLADAKKYPTAEEIAARRAAAIARGGGLVMRPGTPKGRVVVFDCQKELASTNLVLALGNLGKDFDKWDISCEQAADPQGDFAGAKAAAKAEIAVFVVRDGKTPSLLAAPDDGWVAVNLAKMDRNLRTENARAKFYESRCRKQIMRAVALACGAAGSTYPNNIMDVARIEDLDLVKEFVPLDKPDICDRYLKALGFKAKEESVYARAVKEGWAPAPTNDVQKAVWERVHAIPKNPMKIEFDPKKGK